MPSFDAGSIESRVTVDLSAFDRGLREAQQRGERFERSRWTATLDVNTQQATRDIDSLEAKLRRISDASARVNLRGGDSVERQLVTLNQLADRLDGRRLTMTVDINGYTRATAQLSTLNRQAQSLNRQGVNIRANANTSSAHRSLQQLISDADEAQGLFGTLSLAMVTLAPVAGPLVAQLTAVAGALTSITAGAGGVAAVFGGAVALTIKQATGNAKEYTKAQQDVAKAEAAVNATKPGTQARTNALKELVKAQDALKVASQNYTPAERAFTTSLTNVKTTLNSTLKSAESFTLKPVAIALDAVNIAIPKMLPLLRAASPAITQIAVDFKGWVTGGGLDRAVSFLIDEGIPMFIKMYGVIKNLIGVGGDLIRQFAPLGQTVASALLKGSSALKTWADNDGFSRFVQRVLQMGPGAGDTLKKLAEAALNIFHIFSSNTAILALMNTFATWILNISKNPIGQKAIEFIALAAAIVKVANALKLFAIANAAVNAVGGIRGATSAVGAAGAGAAARGAAAGAGARAGAGAGGSLLGGLAAGSATSAASIAAAGLVVTGAIVAYGAHVAQKSDEAAGAITKGGVGTVAATKFQGFQVSQGFQNMANQVSAGARQSEQSIVTAGSTWSGYVAGAGQQTKTTIKSVMNVMAGSVTQAQATFAQSGALFAQQMGVDVGKLGDAVKKSGKSLWAGLTDDINADISKAVGNVANQSKLQFQEYSRVTNSQQVKSFGEVQARTITDYTDLQKLHTKLEADTKANREVAAAKDNDDLKRALQRFEDDATNHRILVGQQDIARLQGDLARYYSDKSKGNDTAARADLAKFFSDLKTAYHKQTLDAAGYVKQEIKNLSSAAQTQVDAMVANAKKQIQQGGAGVFQYGGSHTTPFATGGPVHGGIPGKDSVPAMLMPGEHVWTAKEVQAAGGHSAMYQMRSALMGGQPVGAGGGSHFATGGAVGGLNSAAVIPPADIALATPWLVAGSIANANQQIQSFIQTMMAPTMYASAGPKVQYGGVTLDTITLNALKRAFGIAGFSWGLTQGSFSNSVGASAGTHSGGGALDVNIGGFSAGQLIAIVRALRESGFAAWHRTTAEGFSGDHIHAILVGDPLLSPQAAAQVPDYFRHLSGLAGHGRDTDPIDVAAGWYRTANYQNYIPTVTGAPQHIAQALLQNFGWGQDQYLPLLNLWNGESGWNVHARNPSSGAYGIPQALPASKMASAGPNWLNDAFTQIKWGLGYIKSVYGSPNNAYNAWLGRSPHWYAKGTDSAAKGPAVVGENGPELMLLNGGERIFPTHVTQALLGMARGYASGAYTVRPGDTLSEIAVRNHVSLSTLERLNPQIKNPDLIYPGQVVHLGSGGSSGGGGSRPPAHPFVQKLTKADITSADTQATNLLKVATLTQAQFSTILTTWSNLLKKDQVAWSDRKKMWDRDTPLRKLIDQRNAVQSKITAATAYRDSLVQAGLTGPVQLSGLNSTGSTFTSSAGTFAKQINTKLGDMKLFVTRLGQLKKKGYSTTTIQQLATMGPDQGLPLANELYASTTSQVKQYEAAQSAYNSYAAKYADTVTNLMYDSGKNAGKGFLSGLLGQQADIEKAMTNMANSIVKIVKTELHIKSPSRVMYELGKFTALGFRIGFDDHAVQAQLSASRMATRVTTAAAPAAPQVHAHFPEYLVLEVDGHQMRAYVRGEAHAKIVETLNGASGSR